MNRIVIRLAVVVEVEAEIEQAVGVEVPADVGFKGGDRPEEDWETPWPNGEALKMRSEH